jgi:hypothetical protein
VQIDTTERRHGCWSHRCGSCHAVVIVTRRNAYLAQYRSLHEDCVPLAVYRCFSYATTRQRWRDLLE